MFSRITKTSSRLANQSLHNTNTRPFAAIAGKGKYAKTETSKFDHAFAKNVVNQHAQYITDFDLIYDKKEEIQFHPFATPIKNKVHLVRQSKQYFEDSQIRQKVENTTEYKVLFNNVMEELKAKGIKVRLATTSEERALTGFNVLSKIQTLQNQNKLYDILPLQKHDKDEE